MYPPYFNHLSPQREKILLLIPSAYFLIYGARSGQSASHLIHRFIQETRCNKCEVCSAHLDLAGKTEVENKTATKRKHAFVS